MNELTVERLIASYKSTSIERSTLFDAFTAATAAVEICLSQPSSVEENIAAEVAQRILGTLPSVGVAVSVVIPVYNEETIIHDVVVRLLGRLKDFSFRTEVILCENGSTDLTRQILEIVLRKFDATRLVTIDEPSYGRAIKTGIESARGDLVVIFNADLWSMRFFVDAVLLLQSGYDVVVGSKRLIGSLDHRPRLRRLITIGFNTFLKVVFGFRGTDTHGMKALRRSSVLSALESCVTDKEVFDTELILRLQRAEVKMCEIPTEVHDHRPARLSLVRRVPSTVRDLYRIWKGLRSAPAG